MYQNTHALLISPAEAVELADQFSSLSDAEIALSILEEYKPRFQTAGAGNYWWTWEQFYAVLFFAGRIQGVREERARRKAADERKAARSGTGQ